MQPWSNQLLLKKEKVPTINELILKAESINDLRTRALFILAYLTAGRICELVRYNRKEKLPSIKKKDITIVSMKGRSVLLISIRNEKNKERKNKEFPIPLDKPENVSFYNMLIEYLNLINLDDELFPFNYQRAYKLLDETEFNPHFIRHIRATHLVTVYDFNEFELMKYMGWTDPRPAKFYLELKLSDVLRKL